MGITWATRFFAVRCMALLPGEFGWEYSIVLIVCCGAEQGSVYARCILKRGSVSELIK